MADPAGADLSTQSPVDGDDAHLVKRARAGDHAAFAAIYGRYGDRVNDFCGSVLRDPHEAADATQETFVAAAGRLGQLRDPEKLRPWLYAIARNETMRRCRWRRRATPTPAVADTTSDRAGPEDAAGRTEASEIVWALTGGLSWRDRVLLDLTVRQGLDGRELAEAIGATPANAYVMVSRLRGQVERAIGALLVARFGREDCPELGALLAGWDGRLDQLVRKRVARHVDGCDACRERRSTLASPLALLAARPLAPAPTELRDQVLDRVGLIGHVGPRHVRRRGDGFPAALDRPAHRRTPLVGAAAVVAAVLVVAGVLTIRAGDDNASLATVGADTDPSATNAGGAGGGTDDRDPAGNRDGDTSGDAGAGTGAGAPGDDLVTSTADPGAGAAPPGVIPVPHDADGNPLETTGDGSPDRTGRSGQGSAAGPVGQAPAGPSPSDPATAGDADPGAGDPGIPVSPPEAPPDTPSDTPPAEPAEFVLDTTVVDLGSDAVSEIVTIGNEGGTPADWVASPGAAWLTAAPGGGTLAPGASIEVTLAVDRAAAPEGDGVEGLVPVSVGGATVGTISVSVDVRRPPVVTEVTADRAALSVGGCGVDTTGVTADAVDESGFERVDDVDPVVVEVLDPGGVTTRVPMTYFGGATWAATLGPFASPGTVSWTVVATDPYGNETRTAPQTISVTDCPRGA